jgi:hypothetical protein
MEEQHAVEAVGPAMKGSICRMQQFPTLIIYSGAMITPTTTTLMRRLLQYKSTAATLSL